MKGFNIIRFFVSKKISDIEASSIAVNEIIKLYEDNLPAFLEVVKRELCEVEKISGSEPDLLVYVQPLKIKGLYVVFSSNLFCLPGYFMRNWERMEAIMITHFGHKLGISRKEATAEITVFKRLIRSIGYGSKNLEAITTQTLFHVLNLYPFQAEYYANRNVLAPPLQKKLIPVTSRMFFNWREFMNSYSIEF